MFNRNTVARELHDYVDSVYSKKTLWHYKSVIHDYALHGLNAMSTADRDTVVQLFEEASVFPDRQVVR